MEYQEIVTAYKKGSLDIKSLKTRLAKAQKLKGREKYRALGMATKSVNFNLNVANITSLPEVPEKFEFFESELESILEKYYQELIASIKDNSAWDFVNLRSTEQTIEKFRELENQKKFELVLEINRKYSEFLEYQKLADIRDLMRVRNNLSDDEIRDLAFLKLMFTTLENDFVKKEFYCFDPKFLRALVDFKKGKTIRIEDFMKGKSKSIQADYEKNRKFFTTEDYRDIAENLILTSKTLKRSITTIIEYFSEISESEAEIEYLRIENQVLKELQEKFKKMSSFKTKKSKAKEKAEKERQEVKRKEEELKQKEREKAEKEKLEKQKAEPNKVIEKTEGNTDEMEKKVEELKQMPTVKEIVIPLIFSWLEREDISLTRRIGGSQKLEQFFTKIKALEEMHGTRISMFLVTNAGKEITLKRLQEFQNLSKTKGFDRLVEGSLGGYSAFRIDASGKVIDMAKMSAENRAKIINLVEKTREFYMPKDMIDQSETNYLRYEFSKNNDSSVTKQYLGMMINRLLSDEKVRKQPLKFIPYVEKHSTGIDVLLESQVKGIAQIVDYYRAKYEIAPIKSLKIDIDNIDAFLQPEKIEDRQHKK